MKICDLTQFYSPLSGGVKRYVHEKIAFIQKNRPNDEHVLIIPGGENGLVAAERSRVYSIRSPLVSRRSRYRALLNLRAIEEILEIERPDIIESSDPYQIGWKAVASGKRLRIPVVGFYHSHFPEAYLRGAARRLGETATKAMMKLARSYVCNLYNRFEATLVPSAALATILTEWGVNNVETVRLGVNTEIFAPQLSDQAATTRDSLGVGPGSRLLLYVGRLAPEKNTATLFEAFALLQQRRAGNFHLLIVGDGPQRASLRALQNKSGNVTWIPYCTDSNDLARYYRAADLFVHPGMQETFGLVALESQACGTPVIGIKGSRLDDIIFHDQQSWASENTAAALAGAIETWSVHGPAKLGSDAIATVGELYSWPNVFAQLFCIYDAVRANYRKP